MPPTSRKRKSVAALLAFSLGFGALSLSQATLTSAVVKDAAIARSQTLSTGNVLPRTTNARCHDDGKIEISVDTLTPPYQFRMYVVDTSGQAVQFDSGSWWRDPAESFTWNPTTGYNATRIAFKRIGNGVTGLHTGKSWISRVYTVNGHNGEVSDDWVGFRFRQTAAASFQCTSIIDSSVGPASGSGMPSNVPVSPSARAMPATLMDALNSDEVLEPLTEAAELPAAPPEPAADSETSTQTVTTSSFTNAAPSTPESTVPASSATTSELTSDTPSLSTTAATTRTSVPSASTPPASTTATTAPTRRAGIGDDPIGVGTQYARLYEVDGQPRLVITTGNGGKVCTAEVPGATRIDSAAGELTVTVDGRARSVDTATCAIN